MIKKDKVVGIAYQLRTAQGEELDRAEKSDPFYYLHGHSQIVSGLESALEACNVGDKKKVVVSAAQGYGEVDPKLRLSIDKKAFPADMPLERGVQFEANLEDDDEGATVYTIQGVQGDRVLVDGNHPLAGMELHFEVEVLSVRDATKEELQHGHVHGEGGEHYH